MTNNPDKPTFSPDTERRLAEFSKEREEEERKNLAFHLAHGATEERYWEGVKVIERLRVERGDTPWTPIRHSMTEEESAERIRQIKESIATSPFFQRKGNEKG